MTDLEVAEFVSEINIVRENMEQHGGHFVQGLAKALMYADLKNAMTIKNAFPELWVKYLNW